MDSSVESVNMSLSGVLFVVLFVLFFIWAYKYMTYRPENFPPGPPRFPIWGSYLLCLLQNWNFPHLPIQRWAKKYGNVFGMYLGPFPCLIVCDYESVKEVLVRPEFDGKPNLWVAQLRGLNKAAGIFFVEGPLWHEQRRFSLRHLRDFGFGRRFDKLEILMKEEIQNVVDFIKTGNVAPADNDICRNGSILFPDVLFPCMMNSIMSMFGMESVLPDSPRYRYLRDVGRGVLRLQNGLFSMGMLNIFPWLKYIIPDTVGYNNLVASNGIIHPFIKDVINENKRTASEDEIRNFFDIYFNKLKTENKEFTTFSEDQLHMITVDYMFPSVTAVPATVVFLIQYLLLYPQYQENIQREIDDVVGRGRLPTLDDRKDMPYTEATIREIMRKETFVPLGIVHRTVKDTTFRGYDIPENSFVYTSLYGAHIDKKIWGDPENFRPERFLDHFGKLLKKDYSLPFGAGKRLCAGETFARNSLFLLVSGLLQNFTFKVPKDRKLPRIEKKISGLVNFAKDDCWVVAENRD